MDERGSEGESLICRIEQLQHERDELRKDIEQLCMQQAGSGYLAVATRMHFQRTAGLEQEIESLQKKLAGCTREKQNLQEELSEAYRIKAQLADLHSAEVLKNKEAEKQLKFFQSCVAAAFLERDQCLMESEKLKEREEAMAQKLITSESRVEELQLAYLDEKKLNADLQMELTELKEQNQSFGKVINKFCEIRERDAGLSAGNTWQDRCFCLLNDSSDMWIFNSDGGTSTSKYIASLEEELEARKKSNEKLQTNLRMGLEIEQHLKRTVQSSEKKQIMFVDIIENGLSALRDFHNQQRFEVMKILGEETCQLKSMIIEVQNKISQIHVNGEFKLQTPLREQQCDDTECRDVHITSDAGLDVLDERSGHMATSISINRTSDASDALAQALQEKVSALLLLSQQEERHLLERDVNEALQKKMEDLRRNLSQVTSEKVKALMELAQLKQQYQLLQENSSHILQHGSVSAEGSDKSIQGREREGKLKNLLKRTYLKHWMVKDASEHETDIHGSTDESSLTNKRNVYSVDFARMQVENAALQESLANMEHLASSIHKLRITLLKAQEEAASAGPSESVMEALSNVVVEANLVRTALGSLLPVNWSSDPAVDAATYESLYEPSDPSGTSSSERVQPGASAGLEMVELLILAAQLLKERLIGESAH